MPDAMLDADVAIVGAGVAGLAAAKTLQERGTSFILLEASHRFGGRAYSEWLQPDIPFDLGAHWIHSDALNPFTQLAKELGATTEVDEEDFTDARHFEDGAWLPDDATHELTEFADRQMEIVIAAARDGSTRSVYDVFDNDNRWAPYFYLFFGQDVSCDIDQVSVQDVASYVEKGVDLAVCSGFGKLVEKYGAGVPVQLNSAVQAVDWSGPIIRLVTAKGELRVSKVIVTVSTGVLASQQIQFTPQLPAATLAAIQDLPMGSCTRVGLTYEDPFLHDLPADFTIRSGDEEPLHFRNRPCGHDCVEVVTGGRLARWMEKSGEQATLAQIEARLRQLLGNNAHVQAKRHIVSAWDGDDWIRGAYSYVRAGATSLRSQLAEPIDEKLFFAGEATSQKYFATIHGAFFSGVDTVAKL